MEERFDNEDGSLGASGDYTGRPTPSAGEDAERPAPSSRADTQPLAEMSTTCQHLVKRINTVGFEEMDPCSKPAHYRIKRRAQGVAVEEMDVCAKHKRAAEDRHDRLLAKRIDDQLTCIHLDQPNTNPHQR